jgi:hypothetical protein
MADFHSTGWRAGETVSCSAASATPPWAESGAAVDTDVATTLGEVDFTGLSSETDYIAVGGTSGRRVRFRTGVVASSGGGGGDVTTEDLEAAIAAHASDTTNVHGISDTQYIKGAYVNVDGGAAFRPDFLSVDFVVADDPDSVAEDGDTWPPTEAP